MNRAPRVDGHPARVLIVDDEEGNREVLHIVLEFEHFATSMAASGSEALAVAAESAPHLVLLDVMMQGMDGFEVAARLRSDPLTAHVPILFFTALNDKETRTRALACGGADVLAKPLARKPLVERVRSLLSATYPGYREGLEAAVSTPDAS